MMKRRNWTPKKRAKVLAYFKLHGPTATQKRFRISGSMLYKWQHQPHLLERLMQHGMRQKIGDAIASAESGGKGASNGTGSHRAAIASLQAWSAERFPGPAPTAAELHILNALAALRGK